MAFTSDLKKNMEHLVKFLGENYCKSTKPITNGYIFYFIKLEMNDKPNWTEKQRKLTDIFRFRETPVAIQKNLRDVYNYVIKCRKSLNSKWDEVIDFFKKPWKFQPLYELNNKVIGQTEQPILFNVFEAGECLNSLSTSSVHPDISAQLFPSYTSLGRSIKSKQDLKISKGVIASLRKELGFKNKKISALKKSLWQVVNRKNKLVGKWKTKYKNVAKRVDHSEFLRNIKNLKISRSQLINCHNIAKSNYELKISELTDKLKALQLINKNLEESSKELIYKLNKKREVETKVGTVYKAPIRKSIYMSLINNVPVRAIGNVLKYFSSAVLNLTIPRFPHYSNIARMAFELNELSLLQTGEMLNTCLSATIAHDATTIVGKHVIQFNINFFPAQQNLTINTTRLPGGTACDYATHITSSLMEIVDSYALFNKLQSSFVRSIFLPKLKACITDRAPVNNLVHEMIKDNLQVDILQLHCNVHPLDTIASEVRKCLIKFDYTQNLISSTENYGTAVSFVYNLSKLNHSNEADPHVFRAFLKEEGVNPGCFLRYVGNRFHIMFHMAGVVIRYSKLLHTFLSKYNKNEVTKSLLSFMKLEGVMVQLHALGLVGKFVTGPWMKLVYGNAAMRTNLETSPIFQAALVKIKDLASQPNEMLTMETDVFGGVLKDDVYTALMEFKSNKDQLLHLLSSCMGAVSVVIERQMKNYLTGTLSNPTPQMINDTLSAPTHNMHSERVLGMADYHIRRAPYATIGFLDSKIKAKINKTLEWLDNKSDKEQSRLINYARKMGAKIRKLSKGSEVVVNREILKRRVESVQKCDDQNRKKIEQDIRKVLDNNLSTDDIIFDKVKTDQKVFLEKILNGQDCTGHIFKHLLCQDEKSESNYYGRIQERVKEKRDKFVVSYWEFLEINSEDYDMPVESIITDLIKGDLSFIS